MGEPISLPKVASFHASMPRQYRSTFTRADVAEHASIVDARRFAAVHVELWKRLERGSVLCIVADDRPGLLSLVSASLVRNDLDVIAAHTYIRHPTGRAPEAVDLVTVQRVGDPSGALTSDDVEGVRATLSALVRGDTTVEAAVTRSGRVRISSPAPAPKDTTSIAFTDAPDGALVMTVDAPDRPGLLLAITHALFRARVQIVTSSAETRDGRARDRFTLQERDGGPFLDQRRRMVHDDVLAAVQARIRR